MQLTTDQIKALEQAGVIPSGTPAAQIQIFAQVCKEKDLSPFAGEIHLTKYDTRNGPIYSRIVGIGGYRKIAARTGQLGGCSEPRFDCTSDGKYKTLAELKDEKKLPISCRVSAYRIISGQRCEFIADVLWDEFAQFDREGKPKNKWASMPYHMLAKVAEAFALRKGFSDELSGLDIEEEEPAFTDETAFAGAKAIEAEQGSKQAKQLVEACATIDDLADLYEQNPQWHADKTVMTMFSARKAQLKKAQQ